METKEYCMNMKRKKNMYLCQNKINNEMIRISFFEFLKNVENNFGRCDKKKCSRKFVRYLKLC